MRSPNQELSFREATAAFERRRCAKRWDRSFFFTEDGEHRNLDLMMSDQCPWTCVVRSGGLSRAVLGGSVLGQLANVENIVTRIRRDVSGGSGAKLPKIPAMVLSEVVLNAVTHRSYCSSEPIVIDVEEGYVRVTSPGGIMRLGISYRDRTRNPHLAIVLEDMGFKNMSVHGMSRILSAYKHC